MGAWATAGSGRSGEGTSAGAIGGIGVTWEHDLHLFLRRAALYRAMYGTPEDHYRTVYTLSRKTEDSHA